MIITIYYSRCLKFTSAHACSVPRIAGSEETRGCRGNCRKLPYLFAVGARNSSDPGPVGCRQKAKQGAWRWFWHEHGGVRAVTTATGVFYIGPGPTGTQTPKGVFNKFKQGAMRSCHARMNPETRRLNATSRLWQSPIQLWSRGLDASTKSAHIYLGPKSSNLQPDPGQTDREGCEEYTESAMGGQCLFVMPNGIGDWIYRALPIMAMRV
jgi:hypothetical protein